MGAQRRRSQAIAMYESHEAPTEAFPPAQPPQEDDPAQFSPATKTKLDLAQVFWMVVLFGLFFAAFLPLWLKLVVRIAEWSWGLIG